jgi:hypothetical protein
MKFEWLLLTEDTGNKNKNSEDRLRALLENKKGSQVDGDSLDCEGHRVLGIYHLSSKIRLLAGFSVYLMTTRRHDIFFTNLSQIGTAERIID